MNIPAICSKCGQVFNSGFALEGNVTITMEGCSSGPCPRCGNTGNIPNGIYNFIDGMLSLLKENNYSKPELIYLTNELNKVKEDKATLEEVAAEITGASSKFSKVVELLPQGREERRSDFQFWITTIISILMFLTTAKPSTPSIENNINIINNIMYNCQEDYEDTEEINCQHYKIGRNEKCPCGSGLKYKYCHGDWRRGLIETDSNNIEFE